LTDAGITYLSAALSKMSHGLVELNVSRCGLGLRGVGHVTEALRNMPSIHSSLRRLDLSHNNLRGDDVTVSYCLLASYAAVDGHCGWSLGLTSIVGRV